jgi:hypothetical protein
MDTFDLAPGPLVGKLLAMVDEACAGNELSTREEALALVQSELSNLSKRQIRSPRRSKSSGAKTTSSAKAD